MNERMHPSISRKAAYVIMNVIRWCDGKSNRLSGQTVNHPKIYYLDKTICCLRVMSRVEEVLVLETCYCLCWIYCRMTVMQLMPLYVCECERTGKQVYLYFIDREPSVSIKSLIKQTKGL